MGAINGILMGVYAVVPVKPIITIFHSIIKFLNGLNL